MRCGRKAFLNANGNAQFFNYLSSQALFSGFTMINFATRKFPFEWQFHGRAPLSSQNKSIPFNDRAGYVNMLQQVMIHQAFTPHPADIFPVVGLKNSQILF